MSGYIPYAKQSIKKTDLVAVGKALRADFLTQGPEVRKFEQAVAHFVGAKYAVAVSHGTAALHLACLAIGLLPGDEVITSPITFVASSNAVLYCGSKPVFADVQKDTANIDPISIENKITSKTKAIIPVHFCGQPCDLLSIKKIAAKNNLYVIEDAAHALGAKYDGERIGSCAYSDMTITSFHAVKHITTGEGGMILTNNKKFYEKLLFLRTHGITRDTRRSRQQPWYYEMNELGFNYRITDFQCALGLNQLKRLPDFLRKRKKTVVQYNLAFEKILGIKTLVGENYKGSAHHLYVLVLNTKGLSNCRDRIFMEYRLRGVGVNVHYMPVYKHPYYQRLGYGTNQCPNAEDYYLRAITLPLYPDLTQSQINRVISVTKDIVRKFGKTKI